MINISREHGYLADSWVLAKDLHAVLEISMHCEEWFNKQVKVHNLELYWEYLPTERSAHPGLWGDPGALVNLDSAIDIARSTPGQLGRYVADYLEKQK